MWESFRHFVMRKAFAGFGASVVRGLLKRLCNIRVKTLLASHWLILKCMHPPGHFDIVEGSEHSSLLYVVARVFISLLAPTPALPPSPRLAPGLFFVSSLPRSILSGEGWFDVHHPDGFHPPL